MLWPVFLLAQISALALPDPETDSLRREVGTLSSQGKLDAALALLEGAQSSLPAPVYALLRGKLEAGAEGSRRAYEFAAADSAADNETRGEALFRLGQYYYAAGKYHLAIPEFREYLRRYPSGTWSDPAYYWMGWSCLGLARAQKQKTNYLDTGMNYARDLEARSRPNAYYLPLSLLIKARLHLAKGDSASALRALQEAEPMAPAEEIPGILLLSAEILRGQVPEYARAKEDSLRRRFPGSPERRLLGKAPGRPSPKAASLSPAPAKSPEEIPAQPAARFTLQLGAFSNAANADQLRLRLAAKGFQARVEQVSGGTKPLFRVTFGDFPSADSAQKQGEQALRPLGYLFQVTPQP